MTIPRLFTSAAVIIFLLCPLTLQPAWLLRARLDSSIPRLSTRL
ncbi:MAG TPA: hypothetical protein VJ182_03875 [Anaerolineales bacterium]|nr:hypothetical protein [Anaerolineales bacterium]